MFDPIIFLNINRALKIELRYAAALSVVVVFMFPIIWFGLTAIKPRSAIFNKDTVIWFDFVPSADSFLSVWFGPSIFSIRESMFSSIVIAVGSTLLALFVSVPAAYSLSRMKFPGRQWVVLGALMQRFLPPIAITD